MIKKLTIVFTAAAIGFLAEPARGSFDGTNFIADAPVTLYSTASDVTIATASFGTYAYGGAAILIIKNASSSGIMVNWTAPAIAIGLETTNQLSLPAGKIASYTINTFINGLHTYQSQVERDMPAIVTTSGGGTNSGGGGPIGGAPGGSYVSNGLAAYWKLNDGAGATAADSSGNGNTLSLIGSPSWGSNYLTLNGATQYGDAGTGAAEISWHDMAISAWVDKNSYSYKSLVDKTFNIADVGYGGWGLWVQGDGHLVFVGGQSCVDDGAQTIVPGQWTFVTAIWHASQQAADFYINGIFNSEVFNSSVMNYATFGLADLEVGNLQHNLANGAYAFDGSMHDVAIYNRALSPAEVQANYLATESATNVAVPSLLYYKMTENAQTNSPVLLADSSTLGGDTGAVLLTYPNTLEWRPNQAGVPAAAVHFNGVSTYLDTSNSVRFNFTTNSFTINVWLQPLTANGFIMDNGYIENNGWFMAIGGSYQLQFGSETPGAENTIETIGPVSGWPSVYNMVTITRNGANTPLVYINGGLASTTGTFVNPAPSTNSLVFGVSRSGGHYLDGNIWQPQIWDKALSPQDIANLYIHQLSGVPWP
jgi:hypothetical protein